MSFKYKIEYDNTVGDWLEHKLVGCYWWKVWRENDEYTSLGSGWTHSEKLAMKKIAKAIKRADVHTVSEGEL